MLQKKDKGKILFFRESVFKVAALIFNSPNKTFHIRLLEKETGLSTTAITDAITDLAHFQIVTIEETPLTKNVRANFSSEAFRFYKLVFNLYRLKRYGFIDNLIDAFGNPSAIVVFGSYSRGEDIEESDVDILVISSHAPKEERIEKLTEVFEKELKRKIAIHRISSLEKSSPEFKNAAANGIVLHGYLKVA